MKKSYALLRMMMRLKHSRLTHIFDFPRFPDYNRGSIPRRIWIYWAQGETAAPPIVRNCIASWRANAQHWDIVVLDDKNLGDYIETSDIPQFLSKTKQSNLVRLRLLEKYGGVWADATTFCVYDLDGWLPMLSGSGFFIFQNETSQRAIATWFMVSEPNNVIIRKYRAIYEPYIKARGVEHKFSFQYVFEYLMRTDHQFRSALMATPRISANPSLEIERWLRAPGEWPVPYSKSVPLHKLSWKLEVSEKDLAVILGEIRKGVNGDPAAAYLAKP